MRYGKDKEKNGKNHEFKSKIDGIWISN